jgi:Flp pilus assembly protein TadD
MGRLLHFLSAAGIGLASAWAQQNGNQAGSRGGATVNGSDMAIGMTGSLGSSSGISSMNGAVPRSLYLSGTVVMDDGSPLPGSADVQAVCGAVKRTVAHSGYGGTFRFQWFGSAAAAAGGASESAWAPGGSVSPAGVRMGAYRDMYSAADCELQAEFPGYESSRADLHDLGGQNVAEVGPIVMHRIGSGEGNMVSVLSLKAPKAAKDLLAKGMTLARAHKLAEAQASFEKALAIYPEYVDAWVSLGKVQWLTGQREAARASFLKALNLDNKVVDTWQQLGYLACEQSQWEDAARYLNEAVRLDPVSSPIAWYFSAVANYSLGRFDLAERSIRAEMKLDGAENARPYYLLGLVLIARHDLQGGVDALRNYIAFSPKNADLTSVTKQLSRLENEIGH